MLVVWSKTSKWYEMFCRNPEDTGSKLVSWGGGGGGGGGEGEGGERGGGEDGGSPSA